MIEGEIYVVGGYDNLKTRYLRTVEKYSPATNQWTRLPSMKLARYSYSSITVEACHRIIFVNSSIIRFTRRVLLLHITKECG